jgi:hypothetical protein
VRIDQKNNIHVSNDSVGQDQEHVVFLGRASPVLVADGGSLVDNRCKVGGPIKLGKLERMPVGSKNSVDSINFRLFVGNREKS